MSDQQKSKTKKRRKSEKQWVDLPRLLWGLPSVLLAVAAVSVVIAGTQVEDSDLVGTYRRAAEGAFRSGDFEAADVYYRKVTWLAENSSTKYALAITAERMGDHQRAVEMMSSLAPADKTGYGPAHFWLARDYIQRAQSGTVPREVLATVEPHLLRTIEQDPDHVDAHVILGKFYYGRGRLTSDQEQLEKAAEHYAKTVRAYPENRLLLAGILRLLGNRAQAISQANLAVEHYKQKLASASDNTTARLELASAQVFVGKYREAAATLQQGLAAAKTSDEDKVRYRKALAIALLKAAGALNPAQPELVGKRLQLLQKALEYDPDNQVVLAGLAEMTKVSGAAAQQARESLKDVLATGRAPAAVHLILGTIAMQRDNAEEAEYHLGMAFKLNPRMPAALNNLAWLLAHNESPQLERALDLAEAAVKLRPQNAEVRETRGQILHKLGRHEDALEDLLIALRAFPDRARVHEALAIIYDNLGDPEMSERHRQHVKRIQQVSEDQTPNS